MLRPKCVTIDGVTVIENGMIKYLNKIERKFKWRK